MKKNSINIVIVNYNSTDDTIKCIRSIYQNIKRNKVKIIVTDNSANDSSEKIISAFPNVLYKKPSKFRVRKSN